MPSIPANELNTRGAKAALFANPQEEYTNHLFVLGTGDGPGLAR